MPKTDNHDELAELISRAESENLDSLEPETRQSANVQKPWFNHPWAVAFSWLICFCVSVFYYLEPLPKQYDLGTRSVETRLKVALYNTAHHVESFRKKTGRLPDYLEESWTESENIEYRIGAEGYELIGQSGELNLSYFEGQDQERLLHSTTYKADPQ